LAIECNARGVAAGDMGVGAEEQVRPKRGSWLEEGAGRHYEG
jgi:hypothetical protein